jgi:hypothetical protein
VSAPPKRLAPLLFVALAVVPALASAAPAADVIHHDLSIRIETAPASIRAIDRIRLPRRPVASFGLAAGLRLDRLTVNGRRLDVEPEAGRFRVEAEGGGEMVLVTEYSGTPDAEASGLIVAESETVLSGAGWYPSFGEELLAYRIEVEAPAGVTAVAPGRLLAEERSGARWRAVFESEGPADGMALFAAPFEVNEKRHGRLRLRTYLHPEVADLAGVYLNKTAAHLDRYEASIGAYPFSGFSVVSTTLPVGLGFPGLTLIGTRVLRLPFLPDTSLGHEVLHSWWGNGVLIDPGEGNWAEGLTAFMADYAFAEGAGAEKAHEMRLRWLRDYAVLPAEEDRALASFRGRSHAASQVVGYHKAAALFVMLRDLIGGAAFDDGIRRFWARRRFEAATWSDLRAAFEAASRRSLGEFFRQWIERSGAPRLELQGAAVRRAENGFALAFTLAQSEPAYDLAVPVEIDVGGAVVSESVRLDAERRDFAVAVERPPRELRIDPGHRLFRRLDAAAIAPILRGVAFDRNAAAVVAAPDDDARRAAAELADAFFERSARLAEPQALPPAPCLVVGTDAAVRTLLDRIGVTEPAAVAARGSARAWAAKRPGGAPIAVVSGADAVALRAVIRPLPHYGSKSFVVFDGSRATEHGVWPAEEEALRVRFDPPR